MSVGTIEVTIRIRLNQDISVEQAREFVNEMDYEIKDTTGKVSIADTEVVSDNIEDDDADIPERDPMGYVSLEDCIASGEHLKDCDGDGYCNNCGCQDSPEEAAEAIEDQDSRRGLHGPEYPGEKF
jgi:hypothetical protein